MDNLSYKLREYSKSDVYPFHMPGHKRQLDGAYKWDITEIDSFDNLNNPKGIIKKMNEEIARAYDSKVSYFTVNGSTCGNLGAISAVADAGDTIIVARNCHKSVANAIYLRKLNAKYVMPAYYNDYLLGKVELDDIKKAVEELANDGIKPKAVVITSPTYEGVVSDIESISGFLHSHSIPLIVDMAHGAHFHFNDIFPQDKIECIDICVMSAHKTLPVLNQGAIVHVNSSLVDAENVKKYISMYQTSSPSYVIMESMSNALELISENNIYADYIEKLRRFYTDVTKLKALSVEPIAENRDMGKIVIYTNSYMSGKKLMDTLRSEYKLELEMSSEHYALAMTSCMDTTEGFKRLSRALKCIDDTLNGPRKETKGTKIIHNHDKKLEPFEVDDKSEYVTIDKSEGKINYEMITAYPPGVPLIMPGEIITSYDIDYIKSNNDSIEGIKEGKIRVML